MTKKQNKNYAEFGRLYEEQKQLEKKIGIAFDKAFPLGTEIRWIVRGYMQRGRVLQTCTFSSCRVRATNAVTGKDVWVDAIGFGLEPA